MEKELIRELNKKFEASAYEDEGVDLYMARELKQHSCYADWRNFLFSVERTKISFHSSGEAVSDYFVDVTKMIELN